MAHHGQQPLLFIMLLPFHCVRLSFWVHKLKEYIVLRVSTASTFPCLSQSLHLGSDVVGRCTLALAAGQREGGLALRLRKAAGEGGEGLDQRAAFGHAHLPEFHLLAARPLLRHVWLHLTTLAQVCLVPQHDDSHLPSNRRVVTKHIHWCFENVNVPVCHDYINHDMLTSGELECGR